MKPKKNLFQQIINLGVTSETEPREAVKIRLVNSYGLAIIGLLCFGYFYFNISKYGLVVQLLCATSVTMGGMYIVLNTLNPQISRLVLIFYHNLSIALTSYLGGHAITAQYFLVLTMCVAMLLFRPFSKSYFFSMGLSITTLVVIEITNYEVDFIPNVVDSESSLQDIRHFIEIWVFGGVIVVTSAFAQGLQKAEKRIRQLLSRANVNNEILAKEQERLRETNIELQQKQDELEKTHQILQKTQQSQISNLNNRLEQQIQAINKVTVVTEMDTEGRVLKINSKFSELFHFVQSDVKGRRWMDFIQTEKSPVKNVLEQVAKGNIQQLQLCHLTKLGATCWTDSTLIPFYKSNGEIDKFVEIGFSVDKLVKQQTTLEESRQNLEFYDSSLTKFTEIMRWDGDDQLDEWAYQLLDNLVEYLGAFQGAIYELNPDKKRLNLLSGYAYDESQKLETELSIGDGVIGEVARSQKTMCIENEHLEVSVVVAGKPLYIKSVLVMPLLLNGRTLGVLVLTSLKPFPKKSTEFLNKINENIAANLASIRNNFVIEQLLQESNNKNLELQAREEELRQNLEELEITSEKMREAEQQLLIKQKELEKVNENLEKRVQERTKALERSQKSTEILLKDTQTKNKKLTEHQTQLQATNQRLEETQSKLETMLRQESETRQEVEQANQKIKETQMQLVQSEKMASLGQLVAGIAHEINNPVNFVFAGTDSLRTVLEDFAEIVDKCDEMSEIETLEEYQEQRMELLELKEDLEFEEMREDMFSLLGDIRNGAQRTAEIVKGLRTFSRLDEHDIKSANLHENLDSTLVILHNNYKNRIEIVKDYAPNLPEIDCLPGQINQVFMNVLVNAMQAIVDEGTITIRTEYLPDNHDVRISITDTGRGMPEEIRTKIFEPFFTTKDVGEGTGMGLSITHGIIQKHSGRIEVESLPNQGTTFQIILPIQANIQQETN